MNAMTSPGAVIGGSVPIPLDMATGRLDVNAARPFFDDAGASRIITQSANGSIGSRLVTNALLRYQEWLDIDRTVLEVLTDRLVGIADLRSKGLVYNLGGLGQTVTMWQMMSDITGANISMSGITPGEEDLASFDTAQVPVPIIHKDWRIEMRHLLASRTHGSGIDVTMASMASRKVAEASEKMLFSGAPIRVEGGIIYGYRNFPSRATVDLAVNWTTATPAQIRADVQAMIEALRTRLFHGPFTLYIPKAWAGRMNDFDYIGDVAAGLSIAGRTIRESIEALPEIEKIVVADLMGSDAEAVLVSLTRETVDLAVAQEPTTVSWQAMGGMIEHFKTMAAWVPRIKTDYEGRVGICHLLAL